MFNFMKALILNGSNDDENPLNIWEKSIIELLDNHVWQVETVELRNKKLATCIGCFGCWIKTPGQCILKDEGQEICKAVARSDLLVLLTPLTFGGYSFELKKIVDRLIPNLLPLFTKINGEMHHKTRYEKNPKLLAIGYQPQHDEESERIFRELVHRNSINMDSPVKYAEIVTGEMNDITEGEVILRNIEVIS
jgi:multimeric flavodoxin WrbA